LDSIFGGRCLDGSIGFVEDELERLAHSWFVIDNQ